MAARTIGKAATMLLLLGVASCRNNSGDSATSGAEPTASHAKVARIVFIDKENACDCTRKRADDSWASLEEALGDQPSIPVERIYIDTEEERAAPFQELRPLMVIPGIYFLGEDGSLLEMLQGEVKADKMRAIVNR